VSDFRQTPDPTDESVGYSLPPCRAGHGFAYQDNRNGKTPDAALRAFRRALREGPQAGNVDIATACWSQSGFDLPAEEFGKAGLAA
jgi:hypothetical protein